MIKYIHIGYPKNFSTSLQRDYFSKNKEIFHLGIGLGDNLKYYDDTVNKVFELYLKSCKTFKYSLRKEELKLHFNDLYQKAVSDGFKAFGASSEHLSFAFTYDGLSAEIKAERLEELFGRATKIIMVVRNQEDLIKSLFRESVRVGFKGNFKEYIYYLYKYQDRNYVGDLHYDWIYNVYAHIFGKENVHVLFFENYRSKGELIYNASGQLRLFSDLDAILGISSQSLEFGHYNEALSDDELNRKIRLNYLSSHDLGNHMYDAAEKHRLKVYLDTDLNLIEEEPVTFVDVITKRKLIREAEEGDSSANLNFYDCDQEIWRCLQNEFKDSNKAFEKSLGSQLPGLYLS